MFSGSHFHILYGSIHGDNSGGLFDLMNETFLGLQGGDPGIELAVSVAT